MFYHLGIVKPNLSPSSLPHSTVSDSAVSSAPPIAVPGSENPYLLSMLEDAFTQADYAINITDRDGKLIKVNHAYLRLYRFEKESDVIGKNQRIIRSPLTPDVIYRQMWTTITNGQTWRGEMTNRATDGSDVYVHLTITPIVRVEGVVGFMGFSLDRAQQVQLERQLLHANKLMVLGTLGAGIAHEMNNPLASILLDAEYLREVHLDPTSVTDPQHALAAAESVIRGVERMRRVLQHLLLYSKKETSVDQGPISVKELIEDSFLFVERQLVHRGIEITIDTPSEIQVQGNHTHLESVIHNLIGNSRDAFETNSIAKPWIHIHVMAESGSLVKIEYEDNAGGIPPALMDRIFEPFFTTKPEGKGTGLGLALSRKIVSDHGGSLYCESSDGLTKFRIFLPRCLTEN